MAAWLALIDPISRLIDKIIPDKEAAARAKLELMKSERELDLKELELALSADQGQMAINAEEAKHSSIFVSGWRPFIGWTCGVAFAYHFVLQPAIAFICAANGNKIDLPVFDMDALNTVLMGMLGLGAMRSFDKFKGVSK